MNDTKSVDWISGWHQNPKRERAIQALANPRTEYVTVRIPQGKWAFLRSLITLYFHYAFRK